MVGGRAVVNVPMLNVTLGSNMVTAVLNQPVQKTIPMPVLPKPMTIAAEDATVAYDGATTVAICRTCANALTLTATVKDSDLRTRRAIRIRGTSAMRQCRS